MGNKRQGKIEKPLSIRMKLKAKIMRKNKVQCRVIMMNKLKLYKRAKKVRLVQEN